MAVLWVVWNNFSIPFPFFQDFEYGFISVYKAFQEALLKKCSWRMYLEKSHGYISQLCCFRKAFKTQSSWVWKMPMWLINSLEHFTVEADVVNLSVKWYKSSFSFTWFKVGYPSQEPGLILAPAHPLCTLNFHITMSYDFTFFFLTCLSILTCSYCHRISAFLAWTFATASGQIALPSISFFSLPLSYVIPYAFRQNVSTFSVCQNQLEAPWQVRSGTWEFAFLTCYQGIWGSWSGTPFENHHSSYLGHIADLSLPYFKR